MIEIVYIIIKCRYMIAGLFTNKCLLTHDFFCLVTFFESGYTTATDAMYTYMGHLKASVSGATRILSLFDEIIIQVFVVPINL